jgi:hypothetical protein
MYGDLVSYDLLLITKDKLQYPIRVPNGDANESKTSDGPKGRKVSEPARPYGLLALVHSTSR